ncbi:dihydrolipoyl dehydrogenase [Alicyclobacillus acidocaldarius]|uniref:Dihydrolipoyl dehydrogenase n=1 Tax=Alicyclobacillus acidocaldarius subsp. acidocaldarius (strain ATCC 27009 / DSM 446 / BCRC 14685 / JCM 5260 / KCTC 1825 / NBRC 15652 / NCIMB 11725 / NRRL B-14509 / 104-IA) TaxID=521098 RepID=C8WS79_ALIAD|nr:dihydrolipoyl dehydrogenase [Alicyclobacillus acidocaldarius]ACV57513.1 dihydrolipoamide dehydrogenase [Alicyclobacillus acidocaldarius subsp. acidocaldarius DSM 446]
MVVGDIVEEVEVLVIGAGPGGYVAAIRAAQLGKSVTIVDKAELGGVCLNRGCIPSKALISAAHHYEAAKESPFPGIETTATFDFKKVQEWKQSVVKKMTSGVQQLLKGNKVNVIHGEAFFTKPNEVRVMQENGSQRLQFQHCILATGSRPIELKNLPLGKRVIDSTGALSLDHVPKRLVVVGGGYIGIELGQTFAKFGSQVTIIEGLDSILALFDKQMVRLVEKNLKKYNVQIETNALAQGVEETEDGVKLTYKDKDGNEKTIEADYVLVTVGRRPNTDEIGLQDAGIELTDKGLVKVDQQCRTTNPNVFAIGDIVPGPALAHKASYEGKVAAEVIAGKPSIVDYRCIPSVVFSDPEMASVGLTEEEAKKEYGQVAVGRFPYAANGRATALNATDGFIKLVANKENGVLVGAQVVGVEASNIIAELGLAIEMSATLEDIALTIHAHPTLGEMVMEAAEVGLGEPIHIIKG